MHYHKMTVNIVALNYVVFAQYSYVPERGISDDTMSRNKEAVGNTMCSLFHTPLLFSTLWALIDLKHYRKTWPILQMGQPLL